MLALIVLVGLLSVTVVMTVRVAYWALPSGRMCARCGAPTSPVAFRRFQRLVSRWIQWRWCSRCGWEGAGKTGPDVSPYEAPVDHDSGFRWQRPDGADVPVFWWRSDEAPEPREKAHPSGFEWNDSDAARPADHPSGFRFGGDAVPTGRRERRPKPRPEGFQWRKRR